ncbi:MAG: helicase [Dehalococcoidia bacterium]|nr:MAG: helicase [Dehalococcoidia bacterium]
MRLDYREDTLVTAMQLPRPAVGSLVSVRKRDWVVLPADEPDIVRLRPLTGSEEDAVGVLLPLERVEPSQFPKPDPQAAWDTQGGLLLLDAARLTLRDGAAPFRSLGRLSFTPRPYQFVPLIMALRQDPVRLLIADDVGVGKTIEAGMIARELLDRGLARRLAVICPAHLCEQWEAELAEKFGIQAAVIQPARYARLERELPRPDLSVFSYHRHLIASIDYVKSGAHRGPFLDNAPDLVIVDEAHMAARPRGQAGNVQHQRYEFLRDLAADPRRHLILVTATPHSGIEESFRSLLGLLDGRFDFTGPGDPPDLPREALLPHLVQRRRKDLERWLGSETPFPERDPQERPYALSRAYHALFADVLAYCRESVRSDSGLRSQQQRVRHWAAIALLRCVLSSPRAAASVLAERAKKQGVIAAEQVASDDEIDAIYRPQVLDPIDEEAAGDYVPTAPVEDAEAFLAGSERRRLAGFLKRARELEGPPHDTKLSEVAHAVADLLRDGHRPIVFCRYIATADYLAAWLPKLLDKDAPNLRVVAVTGEIGDEERRAKIDELVAETGPRVLVATDCLSEGINLQEHFDAVVHYDLPWNPNRIEQREGRIDRFGQMKPLIKTVLLYGSDNPVDRVVLEVLIRKARTIRDQLGVSLPVPGETEQVVESVVESVLLQRPAASRPGQESVQLALGLTGPEVSRLHAAWDAAAGKERANRAYFAQRGIKPDEVARELEAADPVLGDADAVRRFLADALQRFGGALRPTARAGVYDLSPGELARTLADRGFPDIPLRVTFDRRHDPTAIVLGRTHPIVAAVCDAVIGRAMPPGGDRAFARCGATFTDAVTRRTAVLLLRLRYLLKEQETDQFAEEIVLAAFEPREGRPAWLEPLDSAARDLLARARPRVNASQEERAEQVSWALSFLDRNPQWFRPIVTWREAQLQESHARLRKLAKAPRLLIQPHEPPDILGCYVLVPAGGGGMMTLAPERAGHPGWPLGAASRAGLKARAQGEKPADGGWWRMPVTNDAHRARLRRCAGLKARAQGEKPPQGGYDETESAPPSWLQPAYPR